jgi:SAM-dependent methyltransferase
MACPAWSGCAYSLKQWADAYHAQTYENRIALQVDNSDGPQTGGNLHYTHMIRAAGIPAVWQTVRFPALWDTLELSWLMIVEHAHEQGCDFIFSVEADVIIPPDAMQKMLDCSLEHAVDGKPAVVTQRYHPRSQDGPNFWWDTLGCSLFPVEPLYAERHLVKAIYEIDVFIICGRNGYPQHRCGNDGPDLFIPDHLKDPEDSNENLYSATPAQTAYTKRVMKANNIPEADPDKAPKPLQASPAVLSKESAVEEQIAVAAEDSAVKEATIPMGKDAIRERPKEFVPYYAPDGKPWAGGRRDAEGIAQLAVPLGDVSEEAQRDVLKSDRIRLNIGADRTQIAGFLSVDFNPDVHPDVLAEADNLPFPDDSVDEIFASHVLEHLPFESPALQEWLRVLKPDGMLTVAVPDIVQIYYLYKHGAKWGEYQMPINEVYVNAVAFGANLLANEIPEMKDMYGGPGHQHKQIFIHDMLLNRVLCAGFTYAHEVMGCFLRSSPIGETMVQARKPVKGV